MRSALTLFECRKDPKAPKNPPEVEVLVLAEIGGGLVNDAGDPIGECPLDGISNLFAVVVVA